MKLQDTIQISGNVLDLAGIDSRGTIAVSVDTVREPGSTNTWKSSPGAPQTLVECFQASAGQDSLKWIPAEDPMAVNINLIGTADLAASLEAKQKNDSLYTLVNLRKRQFDD